MAVPLPSEDVRRQIQEQGYGLAIDDADHFKDLQNKLTEFDSGTKDQMGISGGQTIRTIPLGEPLNIDGRVVYPRAIDQDREELIALDLSIPQSGQLNTIPPPPGSRAQPKSEPNNYVRFPLTNPTVAEFLRRHKEQAAPQREQLLTIVKNWNKFLADISQADKLNGANLVQIPLMVFKERDSLIQPRMQELRSMESHFEMKLQSEPIPSSLLAAEAEWREQINNHSLSLQDTTDTILKLYKGREERIQPDIDAGALNPSDEWRRWWMAERDIHGEDGQTTTVTNYQYIVNTIAAEREKKRAREQEVREEVQLPTEILEEIPEKAFSGPSTFTGPAASMLAQDRAILAGIKDEIKALESLNGHLQTAAENIISMQSKSDDYILQHQDEYAEILNGIRVDASEFVRRYSKSIQNKGKTWKTKPKNMDDLSEAQRRQIKPSPGGGMSIPGGLSASFVGGSIASLGVSIYLFRIIGIINQVDARIQGKIESSQPQEAVAEPAASAPVQAFNKTKSLTKKAVDTWGDGSQPPMEQPQQDEEYLNKRQAALRAIQWLDYDQEKLDKAFASVLDLSGASPESSSTMNSNMKIEMIRKAIFEMSKSRLSDFLEFVSNL